MNNVQANTVEVRLGLPDSYRRQAAEIYYEAFQRKMAPVIGPQERAIPILERHFESEHAFIALQRFQVVGLAGLQYDGRSFFHPTAAGFAREFGWLSGPVRAALLALLSPHSRRGELYLDDLAVCSSMRGLGIGTRLLHAVFHFARSNGLKAVRLDVVDTNPNARRLYERIGFVPIETRRYPFLRHIAGFSAMTTMIKEII
jgi:ribosomal protein S18 acetylase RimI-like enzyme